MPSKKKKTISLFNRKPPAKRGRREKVEPLNQLPQNLRLGRGMCLWLWCSEEPTVAEWASWVFKNSTRK